MLSAWNDSGATMTRRREGFVMKAGEEMKVP